MKITLTDYEKKLLKLDLADVLDMMVHGSGKTWTEVGRPVGWTEAVINRIRDRGDPDYWPSSSKLEDFGVECCSVLFADWLRARVLHRLSLQGVPRREEGRLTCESLMVMLAPVMRESGEVAGEACKAIEDKRIEPKEKRRIARKLSGLLDCALKFYSALATRRAERKRGE